jgi:hypothetical protein
MQIVNSIDCKDFMRYCKMTALGGDGSLQARNAMKEKGHAATTAWPFLFRYLVLVAPVAEQER